MNKMFIKVRTYRGETLLVNINHIISIRPAKEVYHVSLTDFGFDISQSEYRCLLVSLEANNII